MGGSGLSSGYLNNKELTIERFIAHPYEPGAYLYKTGDLGMWDEEGNVHYLGRNDDQIKLRGYRIELGEVERSLLKYEALIDAVVLLKLESSGEKVLVGYLQSEKLIEIKDLRNYLLRELPNYMIPSHFVSIRELPLTSNGKVDKKALLDIPLSEALLGREYIAPRNEIERQLVGIWEDILGVERIGVEDDFFELGGHSIKATRLLNRYRQEFGVHLDLEHLFYHTDLQSHIVLLEEGESIVIESIPVLDIQDKYIVSSGQSVYGH